MKTVLTILSLLCPVLASAHEPNQKILGYTYDMKGLTLQVPSNGCTAKVDYKLLLAESFPMQLTFEKTKRDYCRAIFPYGVQLFWTWEEMGITADSQMVITNEIQVIRRR